MDIDDIIMKSLKADFDIPHIDMTEDTWRRGVSEGWISPSLVAERFEVDGVIWVRLMSWRLPIPRLSRN